MKLRLLPEAMERIDLAREWWRENRDKAPYAFDEELAEALERIVESPAAGQRVALASGRSVYRTLMPKTAFHVYYEIVDREVWVTTIWGAVRGDRPSLK